MNDDLDLVAVSPDTMFISGSSMTEQDVYDAVDGTLEDLEVTRDSQKADQAIGTLITIQRVAGKALAKMLYGYKLWWDKNRTDDNFEDHLDSLYRLDKTFIDRRLTVWECIETGIIPEDVAERPLRDLIPIAKTLSHGHPITRKQFDKIVKANNTREVENILRVIKGKEPRKASMQIYMSRDGSLNAWKDNKKVFIGWFDLEAYKEKELARQAIDRILDTVGVIRK